MLVRMKMPALLDPETEGRKHMALCTVYDPQDKLLAKHKFTVDLNEGRKQVFNFDMAKVTCGYATNYVLWIEGADKNGGGPLDHNLDLGPDVAPHMELTVYFYA